MLIQSKHIYLNVEQELLVLKVRQVNFYTRMNHAFSKWTLPIYYKHIYFNNVI